MSDPAVIIIGAGLAGLSAAGALDRAGVKFVVLERESRVGGLCRTEMVDGFTFDYTGHLLHLRPGAMKNFVMARIGDLLVEHERRASVFLADTFVPYPIQANFGVLPPPMVSRCIDGFRSSRSTTVSEDMVFTQWARAQFGEGLAQLFMVPYNRKLYIHPLEEMDVSWTSWSIPRPSDEEMEAAARGKSSGTYGYNVTFFYPREGGIDILPGMLAEGLDDRILTSTEVVKVDAVDRTVTLGGGETIAFEKLISTMPLPELLRVTSGLPAAVASTAGRLRHSSVTAFCLGFDGPALRDEHWIYFPEPAFPFYRAGYFSNISSGLAPEGTCALYVEAAHRADERPDTGRLLEKCLEGLRSSGLVPPRGQPISSLTLSMPYAYVFHDRYRKESLPGLLGFLKDRSIHSIGRYGAWEYSAMQDAMEQGVRVAAEIQA